MNEPLEIYGDEKEAPISLCGKCAKHPSLKRLICEDAVTGLCGRCGQVDALIRNPHNLEPMVMLIRSLIRFYWDEMDYNHHWGGDSVMDLLDAEANPILAPEETSDYRDALHDLIEQPPYPDADKGVSIYAGFDEDGVRGIVHAISRTSPGAFQEMQRRLRSENFFVVQSDLEALIEPFIDDIKVVLPRDEQWFRARIGFKQSFSSMGESLYTEISRQPFMAADLGAPSPLIAGNGRMNRIGVSMLYLASNPATAIAEIRPHPGHFISVGGFISQVDLVLADFNPDISAFSANDVRLDYFALIQAFDRLMSTPVIPEDKSSYLLTQLLSETLIRRGFDGVRFRSSVSNGVNICVFYPDRFKFTPLSSEVVELKRVDYSYASVRTVIEPDSDDYPIKGLV